MESCSNCRYWLFLSAGNEEQNIPASGICRCVPPQVVFDPRQPASVPGGIPGQVVSSFPPMQAIGWCGHFKQDDRPSPIEALDAKINEIIQKEKVH